MQRQLWVLFGWTVELGAACTVVAVLGIDIADDETVETFIEWVPRETAAAVTWRERLATRPEELVAELPFWSDNAIASAALVEPVLRSGALADAVREQVDDIVGSAY
ncbi:hypothetical protein ILP97_18110 [Amycolatopsis sp. H6(2020)]|nr:hypothetical protein [Amycolatopsis sp. H6(2020)]